MTHIVVKDGKAVNFIVLEEGHNWTPPEGCDVFPYIGKWDVGWEWDGEKCVDPTPPAPPVAPPDA